MIYQQELQGPDETVGSGAVVAYLWSRVGDTRPVSSGIITADTGYRGTVLQFDIRFLYACTTFTLYALESVKPHCCEQTTPNPRFLTLGFQSAKPLPMTNGRFGLQRSSKLLVSPCSKYYTQRCQYWSPLLLCCTRRHYRVKYCADYNHIQIIAALM